jgi:hypothetical protein
MNAALQKQLYDKYPELFSNKDKDIRSSCMAFGVYHYSYGKYPKIRRLLCLQGIVLSAMLL